MTVAEVGPGSGREPIRRQEPTDRSLALHELFFLPLRCWLAVRTVGLLQQTGNGAAAAAVAAGLSSIPSDHQKVNILSFTTNLNV